MKQLFKAIGFVLMFIFMMNNAYSFILLQDDFNDATINLTKWDIYGTNTWNENSSHLKSTGPSGWGTAFISDTTYDRTTYNLNATFESILDTSGGTNSIVTMMGFHDSGTGSSYTDFVYAIFIERGTSSFKIYEDGTFKHTYASSSSFLNKEIELRVITNKGSGANYSIREIGGVWQNFYNSTYSSENNLKVGYVDGSTSGIFRSSYMSLDDGLSDNTPIISLNISSGGYYNYNPNILLSTTSSANYSVSINGGNETSLVNNSISYTYTPNMITNQQYNFTFISRDGDGSSQNTTLSIRFDDKNPSNVVTSFTKYGYYDNFDFSSIISCSDANLDYCNVTTDEGKTFSYTNNSYSWATNGNHTFNVTAVDLAGNINTSINNIVFINPEFRVYFENASSGQITNFSINGTTYQYYFNGSIYDYGLGSHSFIFNKTGFNATPFTLTFNTTSMINTTLSIPGAYIEINIYDITDFTLITGSNTTIEIIGDSFSNIYTTTTGVLNISSLSLVEDTYDIIVSNSDYETSIQSFNYNGQEILEVNAYLTPLESNTSLIADVVISVVDEYATPLRGLSINVIQYVWDSGASEYKLIGLKAVDYDGQTSFKVFLNTKRYNFCAEYQAVLYCETDVSVNINTQEIVIEIPISEITPQNSSSIYDIDFSYSLTNTTTTINSTNYTSVTFTYNNPNQDVDEYCLKIYQIESLQRTLVANQCSTSHSGGLSVNIIENTTNSYIAIATIEVGDDIRELDELYLYASTQVQDELDGFGFVKLIILVVIAFVVGAAIHKKVHNIMIAHIGLPIVFFIMSLPQVFPDYISTESVVLVAIVNYFAYAIVTKKDDISKTNTFTTLNTILAIYMIFIFGLFTALTEIDNKGLLDDYGNTILTNINDDNTYFDNFVDTTTTTIETKRASANTGAWDLLTGIFLKTLEFVDVFFAIMSNLFSIATNIGLIVGMKNAFMLSILKVIDYVIAGYVFYLYFKEAFK